MTSPSTKCNLAALGALVLVNFYLVYYLSVNYWLKTKETTETVPTRVPRRNKTLPPLPLTYSIDEQLRVEKILSKFFDNDGVTTTNVDNFSQECVFVNKRSRFSPRGYVINKSLIIHPPQDENLKEVCNYRCIKLDGHQQTRYEWKYIVVKYAMTVPDCDMIEIKCVDQWNEEITYCDIILRFLY
ncbi:unnamed protein product [Bursaphelenchus xylophilus]|uniref:(pine wood nematode) hypothetical protein n=1 Tax=Bursaphelenchus xylophilus TaxID=6326 RepID=A0A1I7S106_BURXY|nr:unnamed protein product [Bursaphelenchus xylophilus]CAG9087973.1 unnamed protein product [Bursaphelenchus xylophilus]